MLAASEHDSARKKRCDTMGRFSDFITKEKAALKAYEARRAVKQQEREVEEEKKELARYQKQRAEALRLTAKAAREERAAKGEAALRSARERLSTARSKREPTTFQKFTRGVATKARAAKSSGLLDDIFAPASKPRRPPKRRTKRRATKRRPRRKSALDGLFS